MKDSRQSMMKIFLVLGLVLGLHSTAWAIVDNRLCPVKNSNDDGSLFSLRRNLEDGYNRTTNRSCTEVIRFDAGQTFNITLQDTLKVGATDASNNPLFNDGDTDVIAGHPFENDDYNLLVDGGTATVVIDATGITPAKCAIDLFANGTKWQHMTVKVKGSAEKAFCDHGSNNHFVDDEDGLDIVVVGDGGNQPPQNECNNSDPCCSSNHWKPEGEACTAAGVTDGHCNASHQCQGTPVTPAESDTDGVPDADDNCPMINNADQADGDHDGVGDVCDNCPEASNGPDTPGIAPADIQKDSDSDGTGDACEAIVPNTNSDGDTIPDAADNCDTVDNEDQADMDHDGTGDACDNDIDGDGIPNADDSHPTEADADHDDIIDGVDDCLDQAGTPENHGCPAPGGNPSDNDNDGVANDQDQCPSQSGTAENHGCPSTSIGDDPANDDSNDPACSAKLFTFNYKGAGGQAQQKSVCSSGGGCSLGAEIVSNKGHHFMALLSVGGFILLGNRRRQLQKDSNK